jgi:hypothetical protein
LDFLGLRTDDLITFAYDGIAILIFGILGFYVGRWAKNRKHVDRVGTTFADLDPKTGYSKVSPIPTYNELPASIRFEDSKGHIHRRNTQGFPTFTVDFTSAAKNGGIERMYVAGSNSKTCVTAPELCGEKMDDTDLTYIANHDTALWAEAGTSMESTPPKVRAILWQLVLGGLAGFAIGVMAVAFIESRNNPHLAQNATATGQQVIQMVRMVIGK